MNDTSLSSPGAIQSFLDGTSQVELQVAPEARYAWLEGTLKRMNYFSLRKGEKSIVREYMLRMTGYSRQQLTRLIAQYRENRRIGRRGVTRHKFSKHYTHEDVLLLAETDQCHQTLSGALTKKLFERAYTVYKLTAYQRLANISISHLYNLRKGKTYQRRRRYFTKTQRTTVQIAERRKPNPQGEPGHIRIDTVHQGDQDKQKGVYHINAVDEVTQFEVVCSVEKISENYLIPVLGEMLSTFPFKITGFHSDNGSEYINHRVAELLEKLHVAFTKSRSRHSNDNALAECKNGAVVRKQLGYMHIPQKFAPLINAFNQKYFTPYLNYHRPCYFAEVTYNEKGKQKKVYPYSQVMTPYEKLKSLPNASRYLKPGVSFAILDEAAMKMTDLEAAKALQKAQRELFKKIFSST